MDKLNQIIDERIEKCKESIQNNRKLLDDMDTDIMNLYIDVKMAEDTDKMCRLENELNSKRCMYRQQEAEFKEKEDKLNKEIVKLETLKNKG